MKVLILAGGLDNINKYKNELSALGLNDALVMKLTEAKSTLADASRKNINLYRTALALYKTT